MRAQEGWDEHAAFMERLASDGCVVLGGPLGASGELADEVLLIFSAPGEADVRAILARDPWSRADLLATREISPWTVLLESGAP